MAKVYQYDASGYYVGETEDYGGPLPNNATATAPVQQEGFIPRWMGSTWALVENHKGKQGYLDGQPYTIRDYGPLPAGWSYAPPPQPFNPGPDYEERNGHWVRVTYTKKDFMLWCGMDKLVALNMALTAGNPLVKTVLDLLMAADFISIADPATAQMLGILATPEGGGILTPEDVARILAGEVLAAPEEAA